ncbi:hypothetical protein DSL72_004730 [Monilinia vaccinii-corymbosi]|uniref:Uncharacterized protein n=1 Tax=Monilinia vaccinii-corymbosi TaxID=61207 RepID=A0A8A3P199_9HELO|nr:hypothetical protein DSL72_004730 [Monilinia vaccinii-corymbosi]
MNAPFKAAPNLFQTLRIAISKLPDETDAKFDHEVAELVKLFTDHKADLSGTANSKPFRRYKTGTNDPSRTEAAKRSLGEVCCAASDDGPAAVNADRWFPRG